MGLNLDLVRAFKAPKTLKCPYCGKMIKTRFDEYDIECGQPFPTPGHIALDVYCEHCEYDFTWKATIVPDKPEGQCCDYAYDGNIRVHQPDCPTNPMRPPRH